VSFVTRGGHVDLELELVANFLVLMREMHYGRAAARLHLTQAALTKRIQRLERQLGVVLLERPPAARSAA
jgi:DNA-binding transcriptional LysR family regulator